MDILKILEEIEVLILSEISTNNRLKLETGVSVIPCYVLVFFQHTIISNISNSACLRIKQDEEANWERFNMRNMMQRTIVSDGLGRCQDLNNIRVYLMLQKYQNYPLTTKLKFSTLFPMFDSTKLQVKYAPYCAVQSQINHQCPNRDYM